MSISAYRTRPVTEQVPPGLQAFDVIRATTPEQVATALEIRRRVFAEEQRAFDLRIGDPDDARSVIALASLRLGAERPAVATGRVTLPAKRNGPALVAWVATLPEMRGQGAGRAVMRFLLDVSRDAGAGEVVLAAQIHADRFYRLFGFIPAGPLYDVRGIAHRRMVLARPF